MIGMKSFMFFLLMLTFLPVGTSMKNIQPRYDRRMDSPHDDDDEMLSLCLERIPTQTSLIEPDQSKRVVARRVSTANDSVSLSKESETHYSLLKNNVWNYTFKKRIRCHPRDEEESTSMPRGAFTLEYSPTVLFPSQRESATSVLVLENGDSSLTDLLLHVVEKQLDDCDLFLGYDESYSDSIVLQTLALLPNAKQILHISPTDIVSIMWTSARCLGYIFLLSQSQNILTFVNEDLDSWNYNGRFLFVGLSLQDLEDLVSSEKGKKTEHIIGIVKSSIPEEWNLYMNQLYWDEGVQRINIWKENRFTSDLNLFPEKTSDLRGAPIKATTFVWEPDVLYYKDDDGSIQFLYGTDVEVVEAIAQVLNFTIVYREPQDGEMWGDVTSNGTWTGMVGELSKDETDMGFTLFVTDYYLGILDYTIPYKFEMSCFALKMEPPLPSWHALSYPFHLWTWFSLLVGFVFSGPILFLLTKASRQLGDEIKAFQSFLGSCQTTYGMHLNKSLDHIPKRTSIRFYIIFLWIYCFIFTIAYSSNLTAFLTVKKPPPRIETIRDLSDSGNIIVGVDKFYQDMFIASSDIYLHKLAKTYQVVTDQNEIFEQLQLGTYVYQGNRGYLDFIIATKFTKRGGVSELRVMKECFASHSSAIALQKYSPLKRKFNQVIGGMMSGGLIRRYFLNAVHMASSTKEYTMTEDEPVEHDDKEKDKTGVLVPLNLDHMQGVVFISIFGWTLSLLSFLVEMMATIPVEPDLIKHAK